MASWPPGRACSTSPSASMAAPAGPGCCARRRCPWTGRWPPRAATPSGSRAPPAARWCTAGAPSSMPLEGGPHLAGVFIDAGEVDELRLFLAPLVLGGRAARSTLEGEGAETISEAVQALTLDCEPVGDDLLISARLREW